MIKPKKSGSTLEEWLTIVLGIERLVEREVEVAVGIEPSTADDIAGIGLAIDKWREGIVGLIAQDFAVGDEQHGFAEPSGFFQLPDDLKGGEGLASPRRHGDQNPLLTRDHTFNDTPDGHLKDAGEVYLDRSAYYSQPVVDVSSVEDVGDVRRSRSA
jgi:hypothetical protein